MSERAVLASRVGFWSALLTALWTLAFAATLAATPFLAPLPTEWRGIQDYATSFNQLQMVSFLPCLLLAPTVVVLMAAIHYHTPPGRQVLSLAGVALAVAYATIVSVNYYLQLTVVRANLLQGSTEGLTLLAMTNPTSIFGSLEAIGYFFLGLATFFVAPIFSGGRLEKWVRIFFILNGLLGLLGVVAYALGRLEIVLIGLGVWCVVFVLAAILLSVLFRRVGRQTHW